MHKCKHLFLPDTKLLHQINLSVAFAEHSSLIWLAEVQRYETFLRKLFKVCFGSAMLSSRIIFIINPPTPHFILCVLNFITFLFFNPPVSSSLFPF